jgi:hypothetical protein
MLDFIWCYMHTIEHRSMDECMKQLQSQFRAMDQARTTLASLSSSDIVCKNTVLDIINSCGFCKPALDKWNVALASRQ